jgi:hypothetical protein
MPIKPENKKLYPKNWKQISLVIRERAQGKCEFCGAKNYEPHPRTGSKVILTYDAKHHADNARKTRFEKFHFGARSLF